MNDLTKRKPYRNKDILKAAEGENCTVCNRNDGTTVFCHLNDGWAGKGMGQKADDCAGFFGCSLCHDTYDGRIQMHPEGYYAVKDPSIILRAYYRTIRRLLDKRILRAG